MTARAAARLNPTTLGVSLAVQPHEGAYLRWGTMPYSIELIAEPHAEDPAAWLQLHDDVARAIYEALAEHYGHAGHDTRSLRRDYDDERRRVDKLIDATIARADRG